MGQVARVFWYCIDSYCGGVSSWVLFAGLGLGRLVKGGWSRGCSIGLLFSGNERYLETAGLLKGAYEGFLLSGLEGLWYIISSFAAGADT